MYTYTHKETGCKSTKKISYMQIYEEKSAEFLNFVRFFVDFARDLRGFEGNRTKKDEKNRQQRLVII